MTTPPLVNISITANTSLSRKSQSQLTTLLPLQLCLYHPNYPWAGERTKGLVTILAPPACSSHQMERNPIPLPWNPHPPQIITRQCNQLRTTEQLPQPRLSTTGRGSEFPWGEVPRGNKRPLGHCHRSGSGPDALSLGKKQGA